MTAVVVLGMHRVGTSLVASMLQAMGVDMGERLMGPTPHQPHGHFEDLDFVEVNQALLREAGGRWDEPPSAEALEAAYPGMRAWMQNTVAARRHRALWGWKDPRTCLTAGLWARHLGDDVRYVVVRRDRADVCASLERRDGPGDWAGLADKYMRRLADFVRQAGQPVHVVRYEDLTHPKAAPRAVLRLAEFLGLDRLAAARALDRIEYRDCWGFGTVGLAVPWAKGCYEAWLSWTALIGEGCQAGDCVVNTMAIENPSQPPTLGNYGLRIPARLPLAHNDLIRQFLDSGRDTLCFIEDDHVFDSQQLRRMRFKLENQRFDIVCASYVKRRYHEAQLPMGWHIPPGMGASDRYPALFKLDEVQEQGTQEYDGAALGFTLIRRWVLEAMLGDRLPEERAWFEWLRCEGEASPDVPFYYAARRLGARVGVDRDNPVLHMGAYPYDVGIFYRARAEARAKEAEGDNGGN